MSVCISLDLGLQSSQNKKVLTEAITTSFIMIFDSENKSNSELENYFLFSKHQYEKKCSTTRFHPQYELSAIKNLSESCFQQLFRMSWP
ncbi:hypothetical protein VP01_4180g1, partial [Puccinia sorghi]